MCWRERYGVWLCAMERECTCDSKCVMTRKSSFKCENGRGILFVCDGERESWCDKARGIVCDGERGIVGYGERGIV